MSARVIDSLRYVEQSRQYPSRGTASAPALAPAERRVAACGIEAERNRTVMKRLGQRTALRYRRSSRAKPRAARAWAIGRDGARGASR